MKIGNKENINEIILTHKGTKIKFGCSTKPFIQGKRLDATEIDPVEIVFDDLTEVESLINTLERFKQVTQEYIGFWELKKIL